MEALPDSTIKTRQWTCSVRMCKLQESPTFLAEPWHGTSACHTSVPACVWWPHNLLNLFSEPPHFSWTPQLQFYFSHIFCNQNIRYFTTNKIYCIYYVQDYKFYIYNMNTNSSYLIHKGCWNFNQVFFLTNSSITIFPTIGEASFASYVSIPCLFPCTLCQAKQYVIVKL